MAAERKEVLPNMPQTISPSSSRSTPAAERPATLGALRASKEFTEGRVSRSVKDELRANLIRRLQEQAEAVHLQNAEPDMRPARCN